MNATADSLDAGLLRYADFGNVIGTGGWVDTPNQRLGIRPVLPYRPVARPGRTARQQPTTARRCAWATSRTWSHGPQPLIGDAVVDSGPGLLLVLEKSPEANTLKVTKEIDEALEGPAARAFPACQFDAHVFRQANFIEQSIDNLTAVADPRLPARGAGADRLPVRVAHRADQPDRDPAVADGGVDGALPARRHDQHDDPGRARDRRRCGRGRRDHRRREHLAATASAG